MTAARASHHASSGVPRCGRAHLHGVRRLDGVSLASAVNERATVEIVNVDRADVDPGATVGGLNEQLACAGRLEHPSVTPLVNGPPCGASVTWTLADWPAATVAAFGETPSEKLVTVIWTSVADENATPLLLADTLSFVVPNPQFRVEPGAVPHPPVQFSAVRGHWLGSEKPICAADRLAPSGVFPHTVRLAVPANTGSVY